MSWRSVGSRERNIALTPRGVFVLVFVLMALWSTCWSFASPLVAAPDEQAHMIRADAIAHLQIGTMPNPPSKVFVNFTVPASIAYTKIYPDCWHFYDKIPATCAAPWQTSENPVVTTSYVGHYPPLYYALVGTSTWFSQEPAGLYLMRLFSGFLSSFMIALAAYVVARWSRRWTLALGIFACLTPLTLFLGSSVNPSGFEITTAIAFWTIALTLALDYPDDPPHTLGVLLGVVGAVFVSIRGLSMLWVALALGTMVWLMAPRHAWTLLRHRRDLQRTLIAIALFTGLALTWIVTQGTLNVLPVGAAVPATASMSTVVDLVYHQIWFWLRQSVGVLGWLDVTMPMVVYHVWYALLDVVLVVAILRGNWRQRLAIVGLLGLAVAVPVGIVAHSAKVLGIVWQGRDSMPLGVGVVLTAAALCAKPGDRAGWGRLLAMVGVAALALMDLLSFYTNMRRYAVGRYGPHFFFLHGQGWSPPTGQFLTLAVYGLTTVAIAGAVILWLWRAIGPVRR
jgi:hypothetical protein